VRRGDRVTPFYDPLIAKIIVWGADRPAALDRLRRALAETALLGVVTNLGLLFRIATHPQFAVAAVDTGFIERHRDVLLPAHRPAPGAALAVAAVARLLARASTASAVAARSGDPNSPWARSDGWRLSGESHQEVVFRDGVEERTVIARARAGGWLLELGKETLFGSAERRPEGTLTVALDGVRGHATVLDHGSETAVFLAGENWRLVEIDPLAAHEGDEPGAGRLTAPMPGRVTQLLVGVGDIVRRGEPLMIIEAMKMEHMVAAPVDGTVEAVRFAVGDLVEEGAELIALAAPGGSG
jgi:3-methylcrotonyl-CoA carboxylase alpha subunit